MEPELTVAASRAPSALLAIALQARGDALGAGVGAGAIGTVGAGVIPAVGSVAQVVPASAEIQTWPPLATAESLEPEPATATSTRSVSYTHLTLPTKA